MSTMSRLWAKLNASRDHQWLQLNASSLIEGELSGGALRRARRHSEICPECSRVIRTLRALIGALPAIALDPASRARADRAADAALGEIDRDHG